MEEKKRITVLMSVYNGEKFLKSSIESILSQSYKLFDFVIYDDCSSDNTRNIIKSYNDSRIIYRRNETNQGLTKNLADGVLRAKTEYIARMDADDVACSNRLEKQLMWLDQHPDITILGTAVSYFNKVPGDNGVAYQPQDDEVIKATLLSSFTLLHPSIMIRKNDLVKNNINYNPEYRFSQDHVLYLDCIRWGLRFANLPEPLLYMRSHDGSISNAKHELQQLCSQKARRRFLEDTHIADGCTEAEMNVYNSFASGVFPDTPEKVRLLEDFVCKIYNNSNLSSYFNRDIVRSLMAEKISEGAYQNANIKRLKGCVCRARELPLLKYASSWPFLKTMKFYIKLYLSL